MKKVSEPNKMASLHVDDDRHWDQRSLKVQRLQAGVNVTFKDDTHFELQKTKLTCHNHDHEGQIRPDNIT